jgi:acetyl esterase
VVAVAPADVLHDEGVAYARRLDASGVHAQVIDCAGMIHGFARWPGAVPAVRGHFAAICAALLRVPGL